MCVPISLQCYKFSNFDVSLKGENAILLWKANDKIFKKKKMKIGHMAARI